MKFNCKEDIIQITPLWKGERMEDGRPVYIPDNCQTCLACINACPSKAISLTVPEKNPTARYRNEHISLSEIIRANSQAQVPASGDDISAK